MKIFLHIGIEKTGSTTIQGFLAKNKKNLQKRGYGISKSLGAGNNVKLAAYGMSHDRSNSVHVESNVSGEQGRAKFDSLVVKDFSHEMEGLPQNIHTLVLSNEHCHSNLVNEHEVEKVRELLSRFSEDITVIVYIRRQIDVCVSHYSTLLKHGYTMDLKDHISQISLSHFYNYLELVTLWSKAYGNDRVKVRMFDKQKLVGGDLIVDFCNAIEIDDTEGFIVPKRLNESLTPEAQRLLLRLNRFQAAHPFKILEGMHKRFRSHIIKKYPGKGRLPPRELAAQKQSIFDASNTELNRTYFNESQPLFSDSFNEFPE